MFRERACGRRQSFAFGERLLQRREPLAREANTRVQILALAHRGARGCVRLIGDATELGGGRAARCALRLTELRAQLCEQPLRRFVPYAEALCGAAEREQGVAAAAGEQRLGLGAPRENLVELAGRHGLRLPLDRGDARPPLLRLDLQPRALARR